MDLGGRQVSAWVRRVEPEYDNIRVAFGWARMRAQVDKGERMLRLAAGLRPFRHNRGYIAESLAWLDEALRLGAEAPAVARAKALLAQATALVDTGRAAEIAREGLTLFRQVDHRTGMAWCLELIAYSQRQQEAAEESLRLFREVGSLPGICRALRNLARVALFARDDRNAAAGLYEAAAESARAIDDVNPLLGVLVNLYEYEINPERALVLSEQEVVRMRAVGDDDLLAAVLLHYGMLLNLEGDFGRARRVLQESMDLWCQLGRKWSKFGGSSTTAYPLGLACKALGEVDQAIQLWEEQLTLARELGSTSASFAAYPLALLKGDYARADVGLCDRLKTWSTQTDIVGIAIDLAYLGVSAYQQGHAQRSMRLLGAAARLVHKAWYPAWGSRGGQWIFQYPDYKQIIADARTRLSDPNLARVWSEGEHMTLEQVVAYALQGGEADA
jgi:tetratricopeptide (TPR) repeat protein